MKNKLLATLVLAGVIAALVILNTRVNRSGTKSWGEKFPVEGLVTPERGRMAFEPVTAEDIANLSRVGFPEAMTQFKARVRHLVIYQDCHYFFTTDGRVIVMTPGSDGRTPRLVETKRWSGAPHEFRDYRKDLLPTS